MPRNDNHNSTTVSCRHQIMDAADGDIAELQLICASILVSVAHEALDEDGTKFSRDVADLIKRVHELELD